MSRSGRRIGALVLTAVAAATLSAGRAGAHVRYTSPGGDGVGPLELLVSVLASPGGLLLLGGASLAVVAAIGYLRLRPARRDVVVFRDAVADYHDLLPWLLRLSFGLPLVGAGFAGYFFSPAVAPTVPLVAAPSRLLQIGLGFLLLFGLATRAAAALGLAVYLVSVPVRPDLLLAAEYVPGFLAIVLLGSGRPSADQVLAAVASADGTLYGQVDPVHAAATRFKEAVDPYRIFVPTVVRVGLGLVFVLLGVGEKLLAPGPALAVVEKYGLTGVVPVEPGLWVVGAGLTEAALGVLLLLGLFTRAASVLALFTFTLTLFGLPDDPVLAHVSLFGLASVLLVTGAGPLSVDRLLGSRFRGDGGAGDSETGDGELNDGKATTPQSAGAGSSRL